MTDLSNKFCDFAAGLSFSSAENILFSQLWSLFAKSANVNDGFKQMLCHSKLSKHQLAQIWTLTVQKRQQIDKISFFAACRAVAIAQAGFEVDSRALVLHNDLPLPNFYDAAMQMASPDSGSQSSSSVTVMPNLTDIQRDKYISFFKLIVPAEPKYLDGDAARDFFAKAKLPSEILRSIWDLADMDGDSRLSQVEFVAAMYFTDAARAGCALPQRMSQELHRQIYGVPTLVVSGGVIPKMLPPSSTAAFPSRLDSTSLILSTKVVLSPTIIISPAELEPGGVAAGVRGLSTSEAAADEWAAETASSRWDGRVNRTLEQQLKLQFFNGDAIDEWCLDGSLITRIVSLGYERMQAVETVLALHERTKEQLSMELAVEYLCASDQRRSQQRERAARTFAVRYQARCVDLAQIRKTTTPDQNASLFDMAFAGNPNSDIPISTRPTAVVPDMFDWINIAPLVTESSLNFSTSSPISNLLVHETIPCQSQKDKHILQLQAELQTSRSELAAARAEILQQREDQLMKEYRSLLEGALLNQRLTEQTLARLTQRRLECGVTVQHHFKMLSELKITPTRFDEFVTEASGGECVICFSSNASMVSLHCMHKIFCSDCASHYPKEKGCPKCRAPIESFLSRSHFYF